MSEVIRFEEPFELVQISLLGTPEIFGENPVAKQIFKEFLFLIWKVVSSQITKEAKSHVFKSHQKIIKIV